MTEPEPKSQQEKPETDLTDEELEKVAGGGAQPHMIGLQPPGPPVKVAIPPGPPGFAGLEPPGPPIKPGTGSPRDP